LYFVAFTNEDRLPQREYGGDTRNDKSRARDRSGILIVANFVGPAIIFF